MLDRLSFLFGEAMQGLRRHGLMTFAAVSTVAIALYLIGGLGYVYLQLTRQVNAASGQFEMRAFLNDDATRAQISESAQAVRKIPGVKSAIWIPKEIAWEKDRQKNPEITRGLDNPYPDALKITLADVRQIKQIVPLIEKAPYIQSNGVMYHDPAQQFLNDMLTLIRWLGALLGGLLFGTAGVLIYNAIRLTIDSRRREIRIMQLVGASHLTIRIPFLIEGGVQGALGGLVATALLWGTYDAIGNYVQQNLTAFKQFGDFSALPVAGLLMVVGATYGVGCSLLAIRRPAKMRGHAG